MRLLVRFMGFLFAAGTVVFLVGVAGIAGAIWHFSKDLPDYSQLQDYEPPVMTRVHASDGALLGEYSKERRLYLPIQAVPKLVINAFLAAEDKNFYEHGGIDYQGMARAAIVYAQNYGSNRRPQRSLNPRLLGCLVAQRLDGSTFLDPPFDVIEAACAAQLYEFPQFFGVCCRFPGNRGGRIGMLAWINEARHERQTMRQSTRKA